VTVDGLNVLGYAPGGSSLSPLKLDNINLTGSQTTASTIYGNLNSGVETTTLPVAPQSFNEVAAVASFVASDINVYDSLGAQHALNIAFFKLGPNQWTARAYIDGADVGGVAGQPVQVGADATLAFSSSGSITEQSAAAAVITAQPAYSGGAAAGNFTIDLSSFSQYASSSLVNAVTQDGIGVGSIEEYSIEKTGELYANLSGGTRQLIGTIPLAMFTNIDGLDRVGGTLYRNGATVGTISVGTAGDDGRGTIQGAALERSAVDIGEEFTELVLLQRGYQANSQMLNAASGMIKDTIGLML
jgi:flagellar hook protein FlgE